MTTKVKPAQRLTAQRKLELYLATRPAEAPVGEILRQYGLHLDDLRQIEQTIESAALAALKVKSCANTACIWTTCARSSRPSRVRRWPP